MQGLMKYPVVAITDINGNVSSIVIVTPCKIMSISEGFVTFKRGTFRKRAITPVHFEREPVFADDSITLNVLDATFVEADLFDKKSIALLMKQLKE